MTGIVAVSLFSKLNRSLAPIHLDQTSVYRVEVQLIFQNIRRNKKVYIKCKSEKIPKAVVFSILTSLQMLQKACIKIVTYTIYTYLIFLLH